MSVIRSLPVAVLVLAALPALALADDVDVIVGFHGAADPGVFARHGGKATTDLSSLNAHAGRIPPGRLRALRAEAGVAYVEEDAVASVSDTVPNDPGYNASQSDDFELIKAPAAWDIATGDNILVAVLDTGCQLNHPDIGYGPSGKVTVWRNFTSGSPTDVSDKNGHGTHTAGTVGARTNNGVGVAGAGYNCTLAIGKVLGNSGSGSYSGIAAGINWATAQGAKAISMSLGGPSDSATLRNAVNAAWEAGVVLVAAAGNDGNNTTPSFPARYDNCISVAATNSSGVLASFSNFGPTVDIAAPGVSITSTYKGSKYVNLSGTSMATPHVAGVAALVWSSPWGTSAAGVRGRLEETTSVVISGTNHGLLDAAAAVAGAP